jgi:hypothetical protein
MTNILLVFLLMLAGCKGEGQSVDLQESHDGYDVQKLFVVDGCTVYRFYDGGAYYYFTSCSGSAMWRETHYCGKGCITHADKRIDTQVQP